MSVIATCSNIFLVQVSCSRASFLHEIDYILFEVKVSNRSGAGNYHFCDLQTIENDVRKAEKA